MELGQCWHGVGRGCTKVKVQTVGGSDVMVEALQHVGPLHEVAVEVRGV